MRARNAVNQSSSDFGCVREMLRSPNLEVSQEEKQSAKTNEMTTAQC